MAIIPGPKVAKDAKDFFEEVAPPPDFENFFGHLLEIRPHESSRFVGDFCPLLFSGQLSESSNTKFRSTFFVFVRKVFGLRVKNMNCIELVRVNSFKRATGREVCKRYAVRNSCRIK